MAEALPLSGMHLRTNQSTKTSLTSKSSIDVNTDIYNYKISRLDILSLNLSCLKMLATESFCKKSFLRNAPNDPFIAFKRWQQQFLSRKYTIHLFLKESAACSTAPKQVLQHLAAAACMKESRWWIWALCFNLKQLWLHFTPSPNQSLAQVYTSL